MIISSCLFCCYSLNSFDKTTISIHFVGHMLVILWKCTKHRWRHSYNVILLQYLILIILIRPRRRNLIQYTCSPTFRTTKIVWVQTSGRERVYGKFEWINTENKNKKAKNSRDYGDWKGVGRERIHGNRKFCDWWRHKSVTWFNFHS